MSDAIDWLCAAELVIKVPIANHGTLPFSAHTKENMFRLYMLDVGLLGALSELPIKAILDYEYGSYKGYFAENFVAQAFLASGLNQVMLGKKAERSFRLIRRLKRITSRFIWRAIFMISSYNKQKGTEHPNEHTWPRFRR